MGIDIILDINIGNDIDMISVYMTVKYVTVETITNTQRRGLHIRSVLSLMQFSTLLFS